MKKAVVIGSTGLVGSQLIIQLINNENYNEIISLIRHKSGVLHTKLKEYEIDFDDPEKWKHLVKGDVLFSVLGTTLKNAKSKENQYKVDYTYQYQTARAASENGMSVYVLVSSAGAKSSAPNFYLKTKGKLEDDVKQLSFNIVSILQPGQLDGNRKEHRPTEKLGLKVMYTLNKLNLFKKYRPIQAERLAKAMITTAEKTSSATYTLDAIFDLK